MNKTAIITALKHVGKIVLFQAASTGVGAALVFISHLDVSNKPVQFLLLVQVLNLVLASAVKYLQQHQPADLSGEISSLPPSV